MSCVRSSIRAAALALVLALWWASVASANTVLHVDAVHGNDVGSCQSSPCKTLGYAVAQGRLVPDLITIEAAAGAYTEDVQLGAADSGLTIIGAGSGTNPATSTIVDGVIGNPTFNTDTAGSASALTLKDMRIFNSATDSSSAIQGGSTDLALTGVVIDVQGSGSGIGNGGASVTLSTSPITLGDASGSGTAIANGGGAVTVSDSPIVVAGSGTGIQNGGAPVSVSNSAITLNNSSGGGTGISNGGGAVTVSGSPIMVAGSGSGISNGGAPVSVSSSAITLNNSSGGGTGISNGGGAVTVSGSPIVVAGSGSGISNGGAAVSVSSSAITLQDTSGTGTGISNGGGAVTVSGSPIMVAGSGSGISNGGAAVSVSNSAITLNDSSGGGTGISNGSGSVTVSGSPIVVAGSGSGISNGGASVSVSNSAITLQKTTGGGTGISNGGGALTVSGSPIDIKGMGNAVVNPSAPSDLINVNVTMDNSSSGNTALVVNGAGSQLSRVTVSGAWKGIGLVDTGSLSVTDSSLSSGPASTNPVVSLFDGGSQGRDVSFQRSVLHQQVITEPVVGASNVNLALDSAELLGGSGVQFGVSSGKVRTLTVASSTIDAGVLGVRDIAPVQSLVADADNTAGSRAIVNVEGSILVEPPAATRGGTSGTSTVNCSNTEVPSTTQVADPTHGSINCATGTRGNTSTALLSSIFAHPGSSYVLNPSWNGVDSVPASAISLPAPFSDSATDLVGNPRALNAHGTCLPGVRDKGALELTGHGGVVPKPAIHGPSSVFTGVKSTYTGSASNVPSSVSKSYSWHSSDGTSATGSHFSHKFKHAGHVTITLKVTGAAACVGSVSKKVLVQGVDAISHLKLSPDRFAAGKGTVISYRGIAPAKTTFTIEMKSGRKYVKIGTFSHSDRAGKVKFHFSGKVHGHELAPGSYKLLAVPVNPAGKGKQQQASFTIT